ncbi:hypothetical protein MIC448_890006 [Microbacterium sp. C448]|nr:hypothetical protein MIC448_890006 [Microbacterium sp. C448]
MIGMEVVSGAFDVSFARPSEARPRGDAEALSELEVARRASVDTWYLRNGWRGWRSPRRGRY